MVGVVAVAEPTASESTDDIQRRASGQSSLTSNGTGSGDETRAGPRTSNADYDNIRNTTLLFFLDRLYIASREGKEARTLHDLSCLFGTREFTKEMRQIVGASRNGLKKFLQSYPSLFTIEGDRVLLTQLKQDAIAPGRDYHQEAVDYFTQKLLQFGTSLVPIKNLFGYRSQASQEVRHVSGKNIRDFRQFLRAHDDVFEILADEHVVLKSALRELESRGQSQSSLQQSLPLADESCSMDPYLNKQFANSVEQTMKQMCQEQDCPLDQFRIPLEGLHKLIHSNSGQLSNPIFLNMVKTIEDLKVFLRMHPKLFKRIKCDHDDENSRDSGKEFVGLLTEEERQELKAYTSSSSSNTHHLNRQHSTLERSNTVESNLSSLSSAGTNPQPISLPPMVLLNKRQNHTTRAASDQQQQQTQPQQQAPAAKSVKRADDVGSAASQQQQPQAKVKLSASQSSLRASAPPYIPATVPKVPLGGAGLGQPSSPARDTSRQFQRSGSNLSQLASLHNQRPPVDPRNGIRNYLMKAQVSGPASLTTNNNFYWTNNNNNSVQQHQQPQQVVATDDLRARTVDIVREASNIITRIMTTCEAVAFDCKGYNLGFDGQITLIQFGFLPTKSSSVSTALLGAASNLLRGSSGQDKENEGRAKPEVCVFDLITNPELAYCLKPLLESDKIVKIVHDVRNKSNALHLQFKIILNNVFDTQVANLVIQQQDTGKPAYKSRYISMSKLCEVYGDEELMKYRDLIKSKTRHSTGGNSSSSSNRIKDINYWRTRPLTKPMIYESTLDVYCLVGGIYQNLKAKIKPEYRPLFDQLNLEGILARIKPDEIRSAKKERKIDLEVIDLKRKLYSDATNSIVLSNREIRLLRHVDLTDEVRQKIQQCKKVAKKLERLDMKAAQNAQMLQSLNSQVSTDGPLSSLSSNGNHVGLGKQSSEVGSNHAEQEEEEEEEAAATGVMMNSLMDGSMFDELKDKMIESSTLLDSLDDDHDHDFADEAAADDGHLSGHSHLGSSHDCCRCQCHRNSTATDQGSPTLDGARSFTSLRSTASNNSNSSAQVARDLPSSPHSRQSQVVINEGDNNNQDQDAASSDSKSSAVDMAVQCDLLS